MNKFIFTFAYIFGLFYLTSCEVENIFAGSKNPSNDSTQVANAFIKRQGADLVIGNTGKNIKLYSINFNNNSYFSDHSQNPYRWHHSEDAYQQLKNMGANSIRFFLSYRAFEKDDAHAFEYNPDMWKWIDENLVWAKKYGIYLILDFHYPRGGYAENWEIWNNVNFQNRYVALWKAIAQRYKDEPMIAGYELINEPVTYNSSSAWLRLAQNTVDAIRSVDTNHLIILPRMEATDGYNGASYYADNYYLIADNNIMYTFHFYNPMAFTHQNLVWANSGDGGKYPDANVIEFPRDLSYAGGINSGRLVEGNSNWTHYQGEKVKVTDASMVVGFPQIFTNLMKGRALFDEVVVNEYDENGKFVRIVSKLELSDKKGWTWYSASNESESLVSVQADGYNDGANPSCIAIGGVSNFAVYSYFSHQFPVKYGYSYSVDAWMKGQDIQAYNGTYFATFRIELDKSLSGRTAMPRTKAYLEAEMNKLIKTPKSQQYPLYLGEFAALDWAEGKGALQWTNDVLDLAKQNNLHIGYFEYYSHEQDNDHALYRGSNREPNTELIKLLTSKFK